MILYIARRILAALAALFLVLTLAFWATRLMPGHAYDDPNLDPEVAAALIARARLDEPIFVQFRYYLHDIFMQNDWGISTKVEPGTPVFRVLTRRIPASLTLNAAALLISLPVGLALGSLSALKRGKAADSLISTGVIVCVSVPSFVVAAVMQYILAYKLRLFPLLYSPGSVAAAALPVAALALHPIAVITRYLRGELIEISSQDFIALARTKGQTRAEALLRHGLRSAAIPMISAILPILAHLVGGSMVIERLFSVPGVGGMMIGAIAAGDHALTIAALVFYAAFSVVVTLLADISYGIIDPRVKVGDSPR